MKTTVGELAQWLGGLVEGGSPAIEITGVAAAAEAGPGDLTFLGNPKYLNALKASNASAALVPLDFAEPITAVRIRVANPSVAFAQAVGRFAPAPVEPAPGVHPSAVVAPDATLGHGISIGPCAVIETGATVGDGTVIGANAYVGPGARIGSRCHLYPLVVVRERCVLGDRVTVHSGTVIGSDGFGYETVEGRHVKIPQVGIVQVDDDVEIGANSAIDRARFGRTWIGAGTKIDNLVQVAHNVVIGPHSIIVAQVGISGSTRLGHHVVIGGQAGLAGHIEVGDGTMIAAQSGVSKNVPPGQKLLGSPAVPMREFKETFAYSNNLKKLFDRVNALEKALADRGGA
jgi:UDP-3-O-[3-hydroxymyristoyl] glucosamine N-acyltransferase